MKRLFAYLIIISAMAISLGCSNANNQASSASADLADSSNETLTDYLDLHLIPYYEARDRMILPFLEASEKNDEEQMKLLLDSEVLPFYQNQLKELQNVLPASLEAKDLHRLLIQKETLMYENFKLQKLNIGTANAQQMEELSRKYEQYQAAQYEFEERLSALKKEFNMKGPAY